MTRRATLVLLIVLCAGFVVPDAAEAQRSGLIMDLGAGPGLVSASTTVVGLGVPERESKIGLVLKFNISGLIGDSFELYLANHAVVHGTARQGTNRALTGITGVGVTYAVTPDARFEAPSDSASSPSSWMA